MIVRNLPLVEKRQRPLRVQKERLGLPVLPVFLLLMLASGCTKDTKQVTGTNHGPTGNGAEKRASISGRVVGATASGKEAIRVELRSEADGSHVATADLGPSGPKGVEFTFRDCIPGDYRVTARSPGRLPATVSLSLSATERLTTVLALQVPATLSGIVTDAQGEAVPGARVFVWPESPLAGPQQAHSDEAGHFVVDGLAPGTVGILVETAGLGSVQLESISVPPRQEGTPEPLELQVPGHGARLVGFVMEGRKFASGAGVVLGGGPLSAPRKTDTDAQGRFEFSGLGEGRYELRAARGDRASRRAFVTVGNGASSSKRPALELRSAAPITGRVLNDQGQALSGVDVFVQQEPPNATPARAHSDVVGHFSTEALPQGAYRVTFRLANHVTVVTRQVVGTGPPATLRVVMTPAAQISGRVRKAHAGPLQGARITVTPAAGGQGNLSAQGLPADRLPVVGGALPLAAEAAAKDAPRNHGSLSADLIRTFADARGLFVLEGLAPGRFDLLVQHPRTLGRRIEGIEINPGDRLALGDIFCATGTEVVGVVQSSGGVPLPDATVVASLSKDEPVRATRALTDAEGRYALRLPEGSYWLWAESQAHPISPPVAVDIEIDTTKSDGSRSVNLTVPVRDQTLKGRVLDLGRRPILGAIIEAHTVDQSERLAATVSEASGLFQLERLPPGDILISANRYQGRSAPLVARVRAQSGGAQELLIQLQPAGRLQGEVVDARSGRFLANASVGLTDAQGLPGPQAQRSGAGFEFSRLGPGTWELSVEATGYRPASRAVSLPQEPESGTLRISLEPMRALAGEP